MVTERASMLLGSGPGEPTGSQVASWEPRTSTRAPPDDRRLERKEAGGEPMTAHRGNSQEALLAEAAAFGDAVLADISAMVLRGRGRAQTELKGRFDVVTEADHQVESHFAEALARRFPEHRMFGEEYVSRRADDPAGPCWVLDPIDGTVNFAAGIPLFSVSLALLDNGVPLLGWVVDPLHQETFHARRGAGASLNGEPLGAVGSGSSGSDSANVDSAEGEDAESQAAGDEAEDVEVLPLGASSEFVDRLVRHDPRIVMQLAQRFGKFRNLGSQALQLCYVAAGRLRGTLSCETKLWDDAAGSLIAMEAGRRYSKLDGTDVFPVRAEDPSWQGKPIGSICATRGDHAALVRLLAPMVHARSARGDDSS